jgi:uncharacterized membrane protein YoaT (DUF817 family)
VANNVEKEMTKVYDLLKEATNLHIEIWTKHVFLTGKWWFLFALVVVPWVTWVIFRKQESSDRLLYAGSFTMLIAMWMDNVGARLGFWYYTYEFIPLSPAFKPWDLSLIPVTVMFFIQFKPNIKIR